MAESARIVTLPADARGYPQLPGFEWGRIWYVPCDHCQRFHEHGAGPGHRVAHCHRPPAGPYEDSGYVLVHAGEWTRQVREAWQRRWVEMRKAARLAKHQAKQRERTARQIERALHQALYGKRRAQ